jgi:hypothetical protein
MFVHGNDESFVAAAISLIDRLTHAGFAVRVTRRPKKTDVVMLVCRVSDDEDPDVTRGMDPEAVKAADALLLVEDPQSEEFPSSIRRALESLGLVAPEDAVLH